MSSKIWQPAHIAQSTNTRFYKHGIIVLDWPANSPDLNPMNMVYCPDEGERQQTQQYRWAKGHYQSNLGFDNTSAVLQADSLHDTPNWCNN